LLHEAAVGCFNFNSGGVVDCVCTHTCARNLSRVLLLLRPKTCGYCIICGGFFIKKNMSKHILKHACTRTCTYAHTRTHVRTAGTGQHRKARGNLSSHRALLPGQAAAAPLWHRQHRPSRFIVCVCVYTYDCILWMVQYMGVVPCVCVCVRVCGVCVHVFIC